MLIKNGEIHAMAAAGTIQTDVRVRNGKITVVGENLKEEIGELVVGASGKQILPGMIEAYCHLGMEESATHGEGDGVNKMSDPITPQVRAVGGCNPLDEMITDTRSTGVTTVTVGLGSVSVIGGTFVAYKTHGVNIDEMVIQNLVAMKCAFEENPERVYQDSRIRIRVNIAALLQEALAKTKEYIAKKEATNNDPLKMPSYNMKPEAMIPVVKKELPLKCHARRADDILTVIRIAKEFDVNVILNHCTDGEVIKAQMKVSGYPAIVGPSLTHKSKFELVNKPLTTPGVLRREGILIVITTDPPVVSQEHLSPCAVSAMKDDLPGEEALKVITISPAKILGPEKCIGSTEEGRDGDVTICDSFLSDVQNVIRYTIINGEVAYQKVQAVHSQK